MKPQILLNKGDSISATYLKILMNLYILVKSGKCCRGLAIVVSRASCRADIIGIRDFCHPLSFSKLDEISEIVQTAFPIKIINFDNLNVDCSWDVSSAIFSKSDENIRNRHNDSYTNDKLWSI